METRQDDFVSAYTSIIEEIQRTFIRIDTVQIEQLIAAMLQADQIFVVGVGSGSGSSRLLILW